jgi:hypothetical protein
LDLAVADANARARAADARGAEANTKAEGFRKDIATARVDAAKTSENAEREKLARLQLEARLADRILTREQQTTLSTALARFESIEVDLVQIGDTPEIIVITESIVRA